MFLATAYNYLSEYIIQVCTSAGISGGFFISIVIIIVLVVVLIVVIRKQGIKLINPWKHLEYLLTIFSTVCTRNNQRKKDIQLKRNESYEVHRIGRQR